ncbi:putative nucleotidyltransferase substrate binding domain-containing protein [Psychromonas sp. KJ10-10]|uniref:putative nucleotidyltransferase substrate binding domain-containing protein n=1 Tax=Psychromonas sp. KJ10-10 TaxID=3391823 RepID=UPI0039B5800A
MEKKQVNIKNFLIPIVGYLRVKALKHSIPETNSLLRLEQLMGYGLISESTGEEVEEMYNFLMHLRIKWQVKLILDNDQAKNTVRVRDLTTIDKVTLEKIIQQISKLQDELGKSFKMSE